MTQTIIVPIRNLQIYRDIEIGNVLFIKSVENIDRDQPYYSKIQEMTTIKVEDENSQEPFLNAKNAGSALWLYIRAIIMMTKLLGKMLKRISSAV